MATRRSLTPTSVVIRYTASMVVTIIADDLTGACDTGALFAGHGPVGVFVAPEPVRTKEPEQQGERRGDEKLVAQTA